MARQYMGLMLGMLILGVALQQGAEAVTHEVGDELGWTIPTEESFYSSWSSKKTFHVGDELDFKWSGSHNVAKVTKEEYESCTTTGPVSESSLAVPLSTAGTHYFICTVGKHCEHGQKLAVEVSSSGGSSASPSGSPTVSSSTLAEAPESTSSASSSMSVGAIFALMSAMIVCFLTHN